MLQQLSNFFVKYSLANYKSRAGGGAIAPPYFIIYKKIV